MQALVHAAQNQRW